MFKSVVVTPALVIAVMTLVSFWLPPQSGEKLLLNGLACVVICILLMYFSQLLPILAQASPLIGKVLCVCASPRFVNLKAHVAGELSTTNAKFSSPRQWKLLDCIQTAWKVPSVCVWFGFANEI